MFGDPSHGWDIPGAAQAWRLDPERCGGGPIVFDDGHHKFALAWWFMGMPEEVHAWIGRTEVAGGRVDGPAMISFRFPGSRLGVFEVPHVLDMQIDTRHYAQDGQIEITGTKGVLVGDARAWPARRPAAGDPLPRRRDHGLLGDADRVGGELCAPPGYDRALRDGRPPVLTGAQGLEALGFSLAALRSAEAGRAVRLDEVGDWLQGGSGNGDLAGPGAATGRTGCAFLPSRPTQRIAT